MNHHYILGPPDAPLAARAAALVADHQPGYGVRSVAQGRDEGDFGHLIALQADDAEKLQFLIDSLELPTQRNLSGPSSTDGAEPLTLSVCDDPPCDRLNQMMRYVPSNLPICEEVAFLLVELVEDLHDIVDRLVLPPLESHLAGVAISGGNALLLELANDDADQLHADLERLRAHADFRSIRTLKATGPSLVRSPHI